jgi:hypothetical protein
VLAIYFGKGLLQYMDSPVVDYVVYGFIAIAVVGSVLSIMKWVQTRGGKTGKKKKTRAVAPVSPRSERKIKPGGGVQRNPRNVGD